jgi:hypothetical protein
MTTVPAMPHNAGAQIAQSEISSERYCLVARMAIATGENGWYNGKYNLF